MAQFTLVYVTSKNVSIADALSRISPINGDVKDGLDITIHEMHSYMNTSRDATSADAIMTLLHETIVKQMARYALRMSRNGCTLMDILGRAKCRGWHSSKRNQDCYPSDTTQQHLRKNPLRTPRNGQVETESKIICLWAKHEQRHRKHCV